MLGRIKPPQFDTADEVYVYQLKMADGDDPIVVVLPGDVEDVDANLGDLGLSENRRFFSASFLSHVERPDLEDSL